MLVVAFNNSNLLLLHSLALVMSIFTFLTVSFKSLLLTSVNLASFAILFGYPGLSNNLSLTSMLRAGFSAAVLQNALLTGLRNNLSLGEATFIAHCLIGIKSLWHVNSWDLLDKVGYLLLLSTISGIIVCWVFSMIIPRLKALFAVLSFIGTPYLVLKLAKIDCGELIARYTLISFVSKIED